MSYSGLGSSQGREWIILWSTIPGKQTVFAGWVWVSRQTAALINRVARDRRLPSDKEQYRLEGPVQSGYAWYPLKGTTWGTWQLAKQIDWVYTNGEGYMALNGQMMREGIDLCSQRQICDLLTVPGGAVL